MQRLFVLFVLAVAAASLKAQSAGAIVGVVQDKSGAVVPGASVTVTSELTGLKNTTDDDDAGWFSEKFRYIMRYSII